jgi:uncharacterized iron-regulated membrane protein
MLYRFAWRWHFYVGLLAAPVLLIVSLTGALYAFEPQLRPILEPYRVAPACDQCERLAYDRLAQIAQEARPDLTLHALSDPGRGRTVVFTLEDEAGGAPDRQLFVDARSGEILADVDKGGALLDQLLGLHRRLLAGPLGHFIVELTTSWVVVTLLLGAMLWWPSRATRAGWWPRPGARGRQRWRDWHSVAGFYLLPLALMLAFTGVFFSPWAQKAMLGGLYAAGQLPRMYVSPPRLDAPIDDSAPLASFDTIITDFSQLARPDEFTLELPHGPDKPIEMNAHLGHQVDKLYLAAYHPETGERLDAQGWDDLAPGAKAVMLFFPLHTGNILGLGTQILAAAASLLMAAITVLGLVMWWLRRPDGRLGLPQRNSADRPPRWVWVVVAGAGLLMPAFGLSIPVIAVLLWSTRRVSPAAS